MRYFQGRSGGVRYFMAIYEDTTWKWWMDQDPIDNKSPFVNGLLIANNRPLSETMLTKVHDAIWYHKAKIS